jgi:2-polyprenyl-3-methyl-5-hydroxy-6-metoxy-1,4-benzoquinol methylase
MAGRAIWVVIMSKDSRFWDRLAERYSKQPIADETSYQTKLEKTRAHFRPDMEVLEFGCGTGSTAITHAPHVAHILATDISENMLEIGKSRALAAGVSNVTFKQASLDDIEAKPDTYDMVLGLSILHLLDDRDAAISRVHEIVKPGGLFVSSTVCLGDKMWFFKLIAPIGRALGFLPLLRVFTVKQLVKSIGDAGFQIEETWQPEKAMSVFVIARKV